MQTPLYLQVHLQTHPLPTHLRFPGRSRKSSPHATLQGVLGTLWTQWPVWDWGICILGLGLCLLPGVLWGRGTALWDLKCFPLSH